MKFELITKNEVTEAYQEMTVLIVCVLFLPHIFFLYL